MVELSKGRTNYLKRSFSYGGAFLFNSLSETLEKLAVYGVSARGYILDLPSLLTEEDFTEFSSKSRIHSSVDEWIYCIGYVKEKHT